jgi:predicted phosphodiesterase
MLTDLCELPLECDADLICVGHTHRPMNRQIGRWHVINLGSVSNSLAPRSPRELCAAHRHRQRL